MNANLEEIFRVLETQKNSKIVWTLFEKGELDICSLMEYVDYPHRYKSKFLSRYLSKLQKIGYIGNNNGHYFLTPHGVLFVETLGDLTNLKMSNKVRLIKLLRKPKTMEQLYTTLKISRTQCHQLLKCLKKRGIVESEAKKYRICPNIGINEFKDVPLYYSKILNILITKESCSAQEISTATGLALKGVQTRLSELKRMSIVESIGPNPLPQRSFFKFYKPTDMGKGVLSKITKFEKLINFIDLIFQLLSKEKRLTERDLWKRISQKLNRSVNTFDIRVAINFLKKRAFLKGDIVNGYVLAKTLMPRRVAEQ